MVTTVTSSYSHVSSKRLPEAFLTINRNRIKIYGNGNIYMEDGQKFELELFNPLQKKVLAKITINGTPISTSGIILRPGERIYLERYIDINKSFIYKTYQVETHNPSVHYAIKNNGRFEIEFHEEETFKNPFIPYINVPYCNPVGIGVPLPGTITWDVITSDNTDYSNRAYFSSSLGSEQRVTPPIKAKVKRSFAPEQFLSDEKLFEETGTVEKGEETNQNFKHSNDEFKTFPFCTVSYKIEPTSSKPVESKDLRKYCTECGSKIKKNYKHCPNCGKKI